MRFILFLLAVSGGACFGALLMAVLASGASADARLDALRAKCEADIAHIVGNALYVCLAEQLRRKDLAAEMRARIGELMYRWGAIRPEAPSAPTATGPLSWAPTRNGEVEFVGSIEPETATGPEPRKVA